MVDEYQDTNLAQYAIVRALSIDYPNLAVTGDPDQSIYGWRGANLSNILEFEHDFPAVRIVRLEQNYRSTPSILRVADQLISHNVKRKEKALFTANPEGLPVRLVTYPTQRDEADHIAARIADDVHHGRRRPRDFAVFYRVNALSRSLEHALREHGLPYQIVNGFEFYQRKEIKDVLAYLHLINNPLDDVAFLRVINTPLRGIGKTTVARLASHARQHLLSLLEAARQCGLIESIQSKAAVAIAKFVATYDRLCVVATAPVEEILGHVLTETGYRDFLADSMNEEDLERLANIEELLTAAREFDEQNPGEGHLEEFLEQTSLVSDTDAWESESDRVTLMTLHAAKGLEFPVVFIVAIEEGLLPHERSREHPDQLEEERRLLFVGITRAEQQLQLSLSQYRAFRGGQWPTVPSQFLMELPRGEMELIEPIGRVRCEPDWEQEELIQEEPAPSFTGGSPAKMMTAAEMLTGTRAAKPRVSPEVFQHGMLVEHPEHGFGTIVALSGEGSKRMATVQFISKHSQKKFRLAHAPLYPVTSSE
jgi:DNA helicase-2/ATP-dependent DNA helicase PcrA